MIHILVSIVAAIIIDWSVCGRIAAITTKFSYRYRPTFRRFLFLTLLEVWVNYVDFYRPDENYRMILLIILGALALIYFATAYFDVRRQPEREVPLRYGERE